MLTQRVLLATGTSGAATATLPIESREAAASAPSGILVIAKQIDDVISFDPIQAYEYTDTEVAANIYRKLVSPNLLNLIQMEGDLASAWKENAGSVSASERIQL